MQCIVILSVGYPQYYLCYRIQALYAECHDAECRYAECRGAPFTAPFRALSCQ
jgi:hypothetical protein